jgi:hypothetical protein
MACTDSSTSIAQPPTQQAKRGRISRFWEEKGVEISKQRNNENIDIVRKEKEPYRRKIGLGSLKPN